METSKQVEGKRAPEEVSLTATGYHYPPVIMVFISDVAVSGEEANVILSFNFFSRKFVCCSRADLLVVKRSPQSQCSGMRFLPWHLLHPLVLQSALKQREVCDPTKLDGKLANH